MKKTYFYNYNGIVYISTPGMKVLPRYKLQVQSYKLFLAKHLWAGTRCPSSRQRSYYTGYIIYFKPNKDLIFSYFKIWDFYGSSVFSEKMDKVNLVVCNVYTLYVKVRYNKDQFFMVGNQFGFTFSSD